ncbi:bacterial type VI secretion, evfL, impJ, vasE domain-containing protein [Ditylenchus destructor]|uniref:Bacterial type VI secretion, evfL, impJ, vasE domain-containing protein n=1 Tax=Ditylenchus destructor TaxID=166010 RepID=A0AAD4QR76_9BILA|nr:bacterial type VI secretion, evfL, impJ, vasE domain-containing protein [Ditylenchus destructor]
MYLRPQHFQQLERYVEQYVTRRTAGLQGAYWGWLHLDIDRDAFALGRVSLLGGAGVMPDGTPFSFGAEDAPPPYEVPSELTDELIVLRAAPAQAGQRGGHLLGRRGLCRALRRDRARGQRRQCRRAGSGGAAARRASPAPRARFLADRRVAIHRRRARDRAAHRSQAGGRRQLHTAGARRLRAPHAAQQ